MFKRTAFIIVVALAVTTFLLPSFNSYAQNTEEDALRRGVELTRHDRFDEAIVEFNKIIASDPKSANAYYNLGFAYDKKGDLNKAISNFSKAIEIDPTLTDAYYNRGSVYYKKGDFEKAIADYNKVIEISPASADAYYGLGLVYSQKGDLNKAITEYTQAIKIRPVFALAYDARAVAYVSKKNYIGAMADVNKAQALGFRSRPLRRAAASGSTNLLDDGPAPAGRTHPIPLIVAGLVFLSMSVVQFARVIVRAKVVINDRIVIPLWLSMIASSTMLILAVYMLISAR